MQGIYFYGDYCSGKVWGLKKNGSTWENASLLGSSLKISSFGIDEAGNLYMADLQSGTVYELRDSMVTHEHCLPLISK
jgi:hypothetical protein